MSPPDFLDHQPSTPLLMLLMLLLLLKWSHYQWETRIRTID
jgi:hypothetical protein